MAKFNFVKTKEEPFADKQIGEKIEQTFELAKADFAEAEKRMISIDPAVGPETTIETVHGRRQITQHVKVTKQQLAILKKLKRRGKIKLEIPGEKKDRKEIQRRRKQRYKGVR